MFKHCHLPGTEDTSVKENGTEDNDSKDSEGGSGDSKTDANESQEADTVAKQLETLTVKGGESKSDTSDTPVVNKTDDEKSEKA